MAQLWTMLGGNRREVALFKYHRELLAQMSTNRGFARDRVNAAIQQLTKLIEDLSELRDRAAHPVLVGADTVIPLEVHLESLRLGVNRLETFKHKTIDRCVNVIIKIIEWQFLIVYGVTGRMRIFKCWWRVVPRMIVVLILASCCIVTSCCIVKVPYRTK